MTLIVDVTSFILASLLIVLGVFYFLDKTRSVDWMPGIIFILIAIREIFFVIPNYPNNFIRLSGHESWFLLFFEFIICCYGIATIYIKYQQRLLAKAKKN